MFNPDLSNPHFRIAAELVNHTATHIFLTGKAGTGKTTFLKYIRETTRKNCAVVAPTGVAAINAGGVTMHSFFQLPFEPFLPTRSGGQPNSANQHNLFSKIQLGSTKRKVMQELELLIIDEVSMLRCDQLDAIDTILRGIRRNYRSPFGGVQVLFIGDLYQLPPVIKDEEWNILNEYYDGPFFFNSKVLRESPPLYIELKKIYRQKEQQFIDLLNNIRNNTATEYDFNLLHSRYKPDFKPAKDEKYITVTTHNYKADAINLEELKKLPGKEFIFEGAIEREFYDKMLPTELKLSIKEGAQVMFIKNDSGEDRKYYNGKIATVKSVEKDKIIVLMSEEQNEFELQKETWENVRYSVNKETGGIKEEVLGKFTQYPIRLAWAITIHKSQGLTFEKIVIDAGQSFAAGQVYVALSRCTTLDGMILLSRITPRVIGTDERIIDFSNKEAEENELESILEEEKSRYLKNKLLDAFNWNKFIELFEEFGNKLEELDFPGKNKINELCKNFLSAANAQEQVALKFIEKIPELIDQYEKHGSAELQNRIVKSMHWFGQHTKEEILEPLVNYISEIQHNAKLKRFKKILIELAEDIETHLRKLFSIRFGDLVLNEDTGSYRLYIPEKTVEVKKLKKKTEKGSSHRESLALFKSGKSIREIAKLRSLTEGTIESHLFSFVSKGELHMNEIISEEKIAKIAAIIQSSPEASNGEIKNLLGDDFSYSEIRAVSKELFPHRIFPVQKIEQL